MIVVLWVKAGERIQRHDLGKPLIERGCGLQSTSLKQTKKDINVSRPKRSPVASEWRNCGSEIMFMVLYLIGEENIE